MTLPKGTGMRARALRSRSPSTVESRTTISTMTTARILRWPKTVRPAAPRMPDAQ
jgi:hypothetical protein